MDVSLFLSLLNSCVLSLVDLSAVSQCCIVSERPSSNAIEIKLWDPGLSEIIESNSETSSSGLNLVGAMRRTLSFWQTKKFYQIRLRIHLSAKFSLQEESALNQRKVVSWMIEVQLVPCMIAVTSG